MNEKEAIDKLKKFKKEYNDDIEELHIKADEVLIEFLESNGYKKLTRLWESIEKYFA